MKGFTCKACLEEDKKMRKDRRPICVSTETRGKRSFVFLLFPFFGSSTHTVASFNLTMAPHSTDDDDQNHQPPSTCKLVSAFLKLCLLILVLVTDIAACIMFHLGRHFDLRLPNSFTSYLRGISPNHQQEYCSRSDSCSFCDSRCNPSWNKQHSLQVQADDSPFLTSCPDFLPNTTEHKPRHRMKDQTDGLSPRCPICNANLTFHMHRMQRMVITGGILHVCDQNIYDRSTPNATKSSNGLCYMREIARDAINSDSESSAHIDPFSNGDELSLTAPGYDVKDESESIANSKSSLKTVSVSAWQSCKEIRCAETDGTSNSRRSPYVEDEIFSADSSEEEVVSTLKKMDTQNERQLQNSRDLKERSSKEISFQPSSSFQKRVRTKGTKPGTKCNPSDAPLHEEHDSYDSEIVDKRYIECEEALRVERNALSAALYAELEKERHATGIAANEAVAMISRLQAEKAAVQMECAYYQRLVEEKVIYDQQDMVILKEFFLKKERENCALEQEMELRREKSVREKLDRMQRLGMGRQGDDTFR